MTVAELIEKLREFDPNLVVAVVDDNCLCDLAPENIKVVACKYSHYPTSTYQYELGTSSKVGYSENRLSL